MIKKESGDKRGGKSQAPLPFGQEMWYTIYEEEKGPVMQSSPGPRPRGSDTLASIKIIHQPAGVGLPGGLLCQGHRTVGQGEEAALCLCATG